MDGEFSLPHLLKGLWQCQKFSHLQMAFFSTFSIGCFFSISSFAIIEEITSVLFPLWKLFLFNSKLIRAHKETPPRFEKTLSSDTY